MYKAYNDCIVCLSKLKTFAIQKAHDLLTHDNLLPLNDKDYDKLIDFSTIYIILL